MLLNKPYQVFIIAVIVSTMVYSCGIFNKKTEPQELAIFEKTACKNACPVYKMIIYKDGRAILEGKANFEYIGLYGALLEKNTIDSLNTLFEQANFFNLNDTYLGITGTSPSTITTYVKQGQIKTVQRIVGGPAQLKSLEQFLEEIVNTSSWMEFKNNRF